MSGAGGKFVEVQVYPQLQPILIFLHPSLCLSPSKDEFGNKDDHCDTPAAAAAVGVAYVPVQRKSHSYYFSPESPVAEFIQPLSEWPHTSKSRLLY